MTNLLKTGVIKIALFVLVGMVGTYLVSNLMSANAPASPVTQSTNAPAISLKTPVVESNSVYADESLAGGLSGTPDTAMGLMQEQRKQFGEINSKGAIAVFGIFIVAASVFLFLNIAKGAIKARMLKKEIFKEPIDYGRESEAHLTNIIKGLGLAASKDPEAAALLKKYVAELEEVKAARKETEDKRIYKRKTTTA